MNAANMRRGRDQNGQRRSSVGARNGSGSKSRRQEEAQLIPLASLDYCPFCLKNGEAAEEYRSHTLKNFFSKVTCPKLKTYRCQICHNVGGDYAHTTGYCPLRPTSKQSRDFHYLK
ncbi:protein nanos-like [Galendromus occidentalis]|uniref:Protein nanos-like n=1 Tax=Galendromus occidentalis TaxID=34638 RepID=A0AAJ6QN60_9ACAR|nr:protein nanos-like [Galendromus occidentalis]